MTISRTSQVGAEAFLGDTSTSRTSQAGAEAFLGDTAASRTSQVGSETFIPVISVSRTSQIGAEVFRPLQDGLRVFIDGEQVDPLLYGFEIRETNSGISTLICLIHSSGSPVYRPDIFSEIIVTEDGVRIFAGYITQVGEGGFGGPNVYDTDGAPQIVTEVSASDYRSIAQRRYISLTVSGSPVTTLSDVLQSIVDDYLSSYGVTLHESQATGPNLPDLVFSRVLISEILDRLADSADGYVWGIDYRKRLRMWQPGDLLTPFDIDEYDNPANWTDDVRVEKTLNDQYANRVVIVGDSVEDQFHSEVFNSTGVETSFVVDWQIISVPQGFVEVRGGSIPPGDLDRETCTIEGGDDATWHYNPSTNTFTRTLGALEDGQNVTFTFHGSTSPTAQADDAAEQAARGIWEYQEQRSDLTDSDAAQALADSILAARMLSGDMVVRYRTRKKAPSLRAGQVQTITATAREVSGTFMVSEMSVRAELPIDGTDTDVSLIREITAKRNQTVDGDWRDTYRAWN